jgi:NADPH:quinone reductase
MRAIVLEKFGGLDSLVYKDIPEPEPLAGYVVIQVKAFGLNHAEMHMRRGEWAEAAPVSGIECVGLVKSCPGGEFPVGAKVAALMGGLGRTINGSYAEYTRAPVSNVALIESDLPWAVLAAIPETYATAWTCFPLSDVPLQEIANQVASGRLKAKPSRIFDFEDIREAHRVMEANEAKGKMVVVHA